MIAKSTLGLSAGRRFSIPLMATNSASGRPAGVIDQVSAHCSSSYSEKMPPILPILVLGSDKAEVDLIDELGRLQAMALALALHQIVGQTP